MMVPVFYLMGVGQVDEERSVPKDLKKGTLKLTLNYTGILMGIGSDVTTNFMGLGCIIIG